MSYSKKYTKKYKNNIKFNQNRCCKVQYNIDFGRNDVAIHHTISVFAKTNVVMLLYNIGFCQNRCCMVNYNIDSFRTHVVFAFFNMVSILLINLNLQIEKITHSSSIQEVQNIIFKLLLNNYYQIKEILKIMKQ